MQKFVYDTFHRGVPHARLAHHLARHAISHWQFVANANDCLAHACPAWPSSDLMMMQASLAHACHMPHILVQKHVPLH